MLILSRRIGETITIGDSIEVVVVGLHNNQVRLGIEAPRSTPVHRKEIYDRIQEQEEPKRA